MSPLVLLKSHRIELVEKNSRFIGIGCISQSLNEFKLQKDQIEREFADSNHVTFAYRISDNDNLHIRFNDAGEPSGTAGKPILMHMEGKQLINTTIFVVRYFGGIKLGAGGLVRAYGNTARQLILEAEWGPFVLYKDFTLSIPYSELTHFEYLAKKHQVEVMDRGFAEGVILQLKMPVDGYEEFKGLWGRDWLESKSKESP